MIRNEYRLYTKKISECDSCPDYSEGGNIIFGGIERPFCKRGKGRYLRREDGDCDGDFPNWCDLKILLGRND